jgi:hypothetical protein
MDATKTKPINIDKKLVYDAYKAVKANAGAAGVDGQSLEQFAQDLGSNLYKIWNRMSSGSYFPPPVRAVPIPKKNGGQRILGGCGQLLMFWKGGNAILVDFLPELVPPAFGEDEGSQAEDDLSALWGPAHSRTTQPLFDQSFACGLCDA